jgi:hypothetical protein
VCGTKNFSSVRLYSAPQVLHRTIVTIPGICAFGEQDQAGSFAAIKSDPLSGLGRSTSLDRQAAGSMWDAYCSTTRAKSAIVFSLMVDGSSSARLPAARAEITTWARALNALLPGS